MCTCLRSTVFNTLTRVQGDLDAGLGAMVACGAMTGIITMHRILSLTFNITEITVFWVGIVIS